MYLPGFKKTTFKIRFLAAVVIFSLVSFVSFTFYATVNTAPVDSSASEFQFQEALFLPHTSDLHQGNASFLRKANFSIINRNNNTSSNNSDKIKELLQRPVRFHSSGSFSTNATMPNYNVHIFYYPWYKNDQFDGHYAHWNHELLPHWNDKSSLAKKRHEPPEDIGANFYPKLGPYSSADPAIIEAHMLQIRSAGVGVLAVSWYPPRFEGSAETPVDDLMIKLLDIAARFQLKIAFHLEPYLNRNGKTLKEVVKYVITTYGQYPAFYHGAFKGRQLPVFYVYDSYQVDPKLWAEVLTEGGQFTLRGSENDAIFLGLLVEPDHFQHLTRSGFDGFYTYFASNGFVYGSTWTNWPKIAEEAKRLGLLFVPSIGPGYLDTRVRVWNGQNTKLRLNGLYYKNSFQSALAVKPALLSITSFNEWHEGTQVEAAIPKSIPDFKYEDYLPYGPEYYLNLTKSFVQEYERARAKF